MKVSVNWGARNTSATYRVKGANLESAGKFLERRKEWGAFAYSFPHKWKGDSQSNVSSLTIAPTYTITMPKWRLYGDQPQTCKDEWDTMWRALWRHEVGHRDLFERALIDLKSRLEALETAKGRDIDDLMSKTKSDMQAEHDKYDTRTDHGISQGVTLTVSHVCGSKS